MKKLKQLIMHEEFEDRKAFLRHLQTLTGPTISNSFLRTLWSSRFPHNIQTAIASQADMPLESIADLAVKVNEITTTTYVAASAVTTTIFNEMAQSLVSTPDPSACCQVPPRTAPRRKITQEFASCGFFCANLNK